MNKKALVFLGVWGIALAALFTYGQMQKRERAGIAKNAPAESELVFLAPGFT